MNHFEERIMKRLKRNDDKQKKQLALLLKTKTINNLDLISKAMTKVSGKCSTRNALIEDALEAYIETSMDLLKKEGITNLEDFVADNDDFDMVIFPAHQEGFEQVFLGECKWYYVRMNADKISKLKYIGIYVSNPTQAITHYGEIEDIRYDNHERKYKIYLSGEPIQLNNPVPLKDTDPNATRAPRYTKLERLLSATEFKDLF